MNTTSEKLTTCGNYQTEANAWAAFDELVARHPDLLHAYPEVSGTYLCQRVNVQSNKAPRIDRVLVPQRRLCEAGWTHGPFGVEGKASGMSAGPAICQLLDYSNAAFSIKAPPYPRLVLEWLFLFPCERPYCEIESIMANHRLGVARVTPDGRLVFSAGGIRGIEISPDGAVFARELPMGRKVGSR